MLLSDAVNQVKRRVMPTQQVPTLVLAQNYTAAGTTINFTDNSNGAVNSTAIQPGMIISIDLELFYCQTSASSGMVTVVPGYLGSTEANHTAGVLVYINPRFSDFDILTAINNELDDLTGDKGLFNLAEIEMTYNPVIQNYDLTDVNTSQPISNYIEGVALRYKTPLPDRKYRTIPSTRWEVLPFASTTVDANFPSGYGLILNDEAWPGMNMLFLFRQAFSHVANYTDSFQTVANVPAEINRIIPLGAAIELMSGREVERNQLQSQPDPRLAPEVPPGAVTNSAAGLMREHQAFVASEQARLKRLLNSFRRMY
jgi:hypothetical protein